MDPALARRVEDADLIVAVGGRLGDVTTRGYTLLDVPRPSQTLVTSTPIRASWGASTRWTSPSSRI